MTDAEKFLEAYEKETKGFDIHSIDVDDEGSFSWRPCDTCGTTLGGTRYSATLVNTKTKEHLNVSSCQDCVMFAANGELPEVWRKP